MIAPTCTLDEGEARTVLLGNRRLALKLHARSVAITEWFSLTCKKRLRTFLTSYLCEKQLRWGTHLQYYVLLFPRIVSSAR